MHPSSEHSDYDPWIARDRSLYLELSEIPLLAAWLNGLRHKPKHGGEPGRVPLLRCCLREKDRSGCFGHL